MISAEGNEATQSEKNEESPPSMTVNLVAKWGKNKVHLSNLSATITIGEVKEMLSNKTGVLPKRQKLIGLSLRNRSTKLNDDSCLQDIKSKGGTKSKSNNNENGVLEHSFILMGTPEDKIFVDPSEKIDLPEVVDDFDLEFSAGSTEWFRHAANEDNLRKFTESTQIHVMNEPRQGKPLLVLDLDHTLLDFSSKALIQSSNTATSVADSMKRPYMDQFLAQVYPFYDMVVWSQTSWRWLETKLIELNMLTNPNYKFCFVLDKTSMFSITSIHKTKKKEYRHYIKPLKIIWSQFPKNWGPHNTVHLDDLARNFALNPESGLRVTAFHRKKNKAGKRDVELSGLGKYLESLASMTPTMSFDRVNFRRWQDVVSGKMLLTEEGGNDEKKQDKSPHGDDNA
eukprot:CAMPEP_0194140438 /NCGR_PEP_ID=MMETSP0152-20130528/9987_1 /TAXON_ID=1049557 /ORGANISM="Thalassiothrix antarctica, Strain L6-D1" /LENGTH=396 /DNA_ID=CAMNT_0038838685 /DNA_START=26 /DNA_END=1213 /DNA_ORIENTATION=+